MGRLEAFIDGEGSLFLYREKTSNTRSGYMLRARMMFGNTNKESVVFFQNILGMGRIYKLKTPGGNPFWRWDLGANGLRILLPMLKLIIKERKRLLLLEALPLMAKGRARTQKENESLDTIYHEFKSKS